MSVDSRWPAQIGTETLSVTHGGQFLDVVLRSPQTGQSQLLRELGKGRVGEERHVTQQLVTHVTGNTAVSNRSSRRITGH